MTEARGYPIRRRVLIGTGLLALLGASGPVAVWCYEDVTARTRRANARQVVSGQFGGGITLEVWGTGAVHVSARKDGVTVVTCGPDRLEVGGGVVRYNGRSYGAVGPGDTVLVAADGSLSVNGQKRRPRWFGDRRSNPRFPDPAT
jgi:hypothetical protein